MKYYVGVELGVSNITVGVVDKYCRLIRKDKVPTLKDRPYTEIIKDIAALTIKILSSENIDLRDIKYIGVGCPGVPDNKQGVIVRNYTLNFKNTPIRAELQRHINVPVFVENDANCAALAESVTGAAEDIWHSVTIKIGTGIGGGIIIGNKIYSGFNFAGAELGHMVIDLDGEQCTCGRKGCWEAYASATALIKQTREAAKNDCNSIIHEVVNKDLAQINEFTAFEAGKRGDETGKRVYKQYIAYLAEGIINIINILQPEAVIIGGEISKLGDFLIRPLKDIVYDRVYSKDVKQPEFKIAEVGSAAIILGASMLGINRES